MDARQFVAEFGHIANAPSGVARLRDLILSLAFRGDLCARSAESAGDLLVDMRRQRELADNETRTQRTVRNGMGTSSISGPYDIPSNWRWVCLSAVGHTWGQTKPTKPFSYIDVSSIDNKAGVISPQVEIVAAAAAPSRARKIVRNGTLIYSTIRPYLLNIAIVDRAIDPEPIASTAFAVVHPWSGVHARFVYHYLRSPYFIRYVESVQTGMAYPAISDEKFYSGSLPLPPSEEQARIVAKVDELMVLCDKLEAQQQARESRKAVLAQALLARFAEEPTQANLHSLFHSSRAIATADLRKAVLALAVQGKLVPQDPNDEPVRIALDQLEAQGGSVRTRRGVPSVVKRPEVVARVGFPDSWQIESTARLLRLGAIIDLKDGNHGANHPKVADFTDSGLAFITAAQVLDNGQIDYEGAYKVSGGPLSRLRVGFAKPRDVIYTHKGSVGRVAICDRECILTPQTTYYRVNGDILNNKYVRFYLLSTLFQDQVDLVKGQTTRDFVPISAQYNFFISIPPIAEQYRIVSRVEQLMGLLDRLEAQLATANTIGKRLAESVVSTLTGIATSAPQDLIVKVSPDQDGTRDAAVAECIP